jgi:phytoene/squalene synthetase
MSDPRSAFVLPPVVRLALRRLPPARRAAPQAWLHWHLACGARLGAAWVAGAGELPRAALALHAEARPALLAAVPPRDFRAAIDGWHALLLLGRPPTWRRIENVLHQVAATPTRTAGALLGLDAEGERARLEALGLAIGSTRLLLGLRSGLATGRVPIPEEDFEASGTSLADLMDGRPGEGVLSRQVARARAYLDAAAGLGVTAADPATSRFVEDILAWQNALLDRLARDPAAGELGRLEALRLLLGRRPGRES